VIKVWVYKRKHIKGWWVGWYESGKRKAKALPSKALAEHYRQIKYTQLNSDVFTGTVTVDWKQMIEEYRHGKQVAGFVEDSLYEAALTLRHFERLVGKCNSKQITNQAVEGRRETCEILEQRPDKENAYSIQNISNDEDENSVGFGHRPQTWRH